MLPISELTASILMPKIFAQEIEIVMYTVRSYLAYNTTVVKGKRYMNEGDGECEYVFECYGWCVP